MRTREHNRTKAPLYEQKVAENRARIAPAHFSFMKVGREGEGGIRKREEGGIWPHKQNLELFAGSC